MVTGMIGLSGNGDRSKLSLIWQHILTRKHVESIFRKQLKPPEEING